MSEDVSERMENFMHIKRFTSGVCLANTYILSKEGSDNAYMFDSCGNTELIFKYLDKNNLRLKGIFLTHGHFDHIAYLEEMKEKTGAPVYIYESEDAFLSNPHLNLSDLDGADEDPTGEMFKLKNADIKLKDGEIIKTDDFDIRVIHTPGHTSGSVCYLAENALFSGDTLFKNSVGRADFPTGNAAEEIKSIKEKLMTLNGDIKVYPGHGFSTTIEEERKENPYLAY